MSKGSKQRPGSGYSTGWDAIFGKKIPELEGVPRLSETTTCACEPRDCQHPKDCRDWTKRRLAVVS